MAANKFAIMLHKNCHKIIVILVYALLEWILILLLLSNSFFSHLISKFAKFFGLKPSCTWCSKSDHIFDSKNSENSDFDHLCEAHGTELSNLSYCHNHKRLSESKSLCTECSFSRQVENGIPSTVTFFTCVLDNGEENRCSCCDEKILSPKIINPQSLFFKHSLEVLDCINKKGTIDEEQTMTQNKSLSQSDRVNDDDDFVEKSDNFEVQECKADVTYQPADDPFSSSGCNDEDDETVYITDMLLQNAEYLDSDGFICIELIDIDTNGTSSSRLIDEYERRDEDIEKCRQIFSAAPSREEVPDNFPDSQAEEKRYSSERTETSELQIIDDDSLTTEHLKTTIKSQQNALSALYAELEEERKAAAVAADETMAMITKLQEEKANTQMEALQYQRMMEEQAEYDQEAMQILNDLMTKREKEKQELEKELDLYRDKALDYDGKSNDNHSIDHECDYSREHDLDEDLEENEVFLVEFDEERLSVLEELKFLEAKLFALHDNVSSDNKSHYERETNDLMDKSKLFIHEELGHVYERLQALEADREFLKHCMRSMTKGNKGLALVKEILQHLRDLRSVELSAGNLDELSLANVSLDKEDQR